MPIKIHHGPPGSYKTAGAMGDDFLREARAGRVIVTNVRGVSRDRCLDEFPDLPDTFDVIHVSDQSEEGRAKWAKWFHWAPKGAFIFVDEIQDIWPKRWRDADLRVLDYPGGVEAATKDDRPKDWEQAWDKHRHWNWDIVATCPSYKKVRDDIKSVADAAYKHKDLALIGWTGRYMEGMHAADDEGKSQNDFQTIERKKVPAYVFKLYDSTATGKHSHTRSGFNIFTSPRVLLLLLILGGMGAFAFTRPVPKVLGGIGKGLPSGDSSSASVPLQDAAAAGGVAPAPVASRANLEDARIEPFSDGDAYVTISYKVGLIWKYAVSMGGGEFTSADLLDMGYSVQGMGACAVKITKDRFNRIIVCHQTENNSKDVVAAPVSHKQLPGESV